MTSSFNNGRLGWPVNHKSHKLVRVHAQMGFNLIEILVIVSIVSILTSFASPNFFSSFLTSQSTSQIESVYKSITYARSEAHDKYGRRVVMCASSDGASCGTSQWEKGWILFVDNNQNHQYDASSDVILRKVADLGTDVTLRTSGFDSSGRLSFNGQGMPDSTGAFVLCNQQGVESANALIVNVLGQVRLAAEEDGDDSIVNIKKGVNVSCPS